MIFEILNNPRISQQRISPTMKPSLPPPSHARRRTLLGTAVAACASLLPALLSETACAEDDPEVVAFKAYVAGRKVHTGRLKLDVPRIADNGNVVPVKITMAGPFAPGAEVRSVHLFSEKNPVAQMAVFHFPVAVPRVEMESRVRLAGSQRLAALATLADGSLHSATADIAVTVSACLDGS